MKLYTTVTSERASKGQGGNRFLDIKIQSGKEQVEILRLLINDTPLDKSYTTARIVSVTGNANYLYELSEEINKTLLIDIENSKGKKQKGEEQKCSKCDENLYGLVKVHHHN